MSIHLHIDPFSGIAGDMFLGAMIDLGADIAAISKALESLPIHEPFRLEATRVTRCGITATDLKVVVEGHSHHHRHYRDLLKAVDALVTTDRGRARARATVERLAQAEARVHGVPVERVHFHEVGAIDSIVDMLGSAVAMELLNVQTVSCGAMPLSRGMVDCDHGKMPLPAPATAYLLEGRPTFGVDRTDELVTPTGAAIAVAVSESFGPPPRMTITRVGYGAGDRDDKHTPNVLRLFLGQT